MFLPIFIPSPSCSRKASCLSPSRRPPGPLFSLPDKLKKMLIHALHPARRARLDNRIDLDILPSRMVAARAGDPIRISMAAHLPLPSFVFKSCWATTALKDSASMVRSVPAGRWKSIYDPVNGLGCIVRVKGAKDQNAQFRAGECQRNGGGVLISPTRIISGSSRPATLRCVRKAQAWVPISRCVKRHFLFE